MTKLHRVPLLHYGKAHMPHAPLTFCLGTGVLTRVPDT